MKNSSAKQANKLKRLDPFRLFISLLITFFVAGSFNIIVASAATQPSVVGTTIIYLLVILSTPLLIYKILGMKWQQRLPYLIGLFFVGSFLTGIFYERIGGIFSNIVTLSLFAIPIALMPATALSIPFAVWTSLSLGKKVYLPLWSFYAALLTIFAWPREPYYDNQDEFFVVEGLLLLGALCVTILAIHILIIRKYTKVVWSQKKVKTSGSVRRRRIGKKIALVTLGAVALLGIHLALTFDWNGSSKEFTELSNQEKALSLPKADKRIASDECYWTSSTESTTEKVRHCHQAISLIYNDITIVGEVRDRLVANGWKEEGYVQHIGGTRLGDPPTIDQISQGVMPTLASHSDYFFTAKQGESIKICAKITVHAKGDARNPTDPSLDVHMNAC